MANVVRQARLPSLLERNHDPSYAINRQASK